MEGASVLLGVEGQNRKEGPEVPFYALRSLVAKLRFSTSGDKMSFARVFGHSEIDVSVRYPRLVSALYPSSALSRSGNSPVMTGRSEAMCVSQAI